MKIIDVNLRFGTGSMRRGDPNGIVLHHAASNGSVEHIHNIHLNNGWVGIGYHFYVRKDGSVYRGRSEDWVGAHTVGHNATKIGICAEGNFENETMPTAQKNAIIELLAYLFGKYGNLKVYGHKDLDATACPGRNYPFNEIVNGAKNFGKVEAETTNEEGSTVKVELKMLGKGDEGEQVKTLQHLLIAKGYNLKKYGADGDFGGETDAAVRAFQRDNHLDVDGIVGKQTWSRLLGVT